MDELHFGPLKSQLLARLEVTPTGTHSAFDSLRVRCVLSPLQIQIGIFGSKDLKPDKSSPPRGLRVPRTARLASLLSRLMSCVEGVLGGVSGGPPPSLTRPREVAPCRIQIPLVFRRHTRP